MNYNRYLGSSSGDQIPKMNKLALLWGEAQLCLPYIRLRKRKEYNQQ